MDRGGLPCDSEVNCSERTDCGAEGVTGYSEGVVRIEGICRRDESFGVRLDLLPRLVESVVNVAAVTLRKGRQDEVEIRNPVPQVRRATEGNDNLFSYIIDSHVALQVKHCGVSVIGDKVSTQVSGGTRQLKQYLSTYGMTPRIVAPLAITSGQPPSHVTNAPTASSELQYAEAEY